MNTLFIESLDGYTYASRRDAAEAYSEEADYLTMAYAESGGAGGLCLPRWNPDGKVWSPELRAWAHPDPWATAA